MEQSLIYFVNIHCVKFTWLDEKLEYVTTL